MFIVQILSVMPIFHTRILSILSLLHDIQMLLLSCLLPEHTPTTTIIFIT